MSRSSQRKKQADNSMSDNLVGEMSGAEQLNAPVLLLMVEKFMEKMMQGQLQVDEARGKAETQARAMELEAQVLRDEKKNQKSEERRIREQVLSGIALYKEGDDLEGYLRVVEDSYIKAGLAKCEWMFNLRAKLVGKALEFFSEISGTTNDYDEARSRLLTCMGYTAKRSGIEYYDVCKETLRKLDPDSLIAKGKALFKRTCGEHIPDSVTICHHVKAWVYNVLTHKARSYVDARSINNLEELASTLRDYVTIEGSLKGGVKASFQPKLDKKEIISCFKCGKVGHKAVDCYSRTYSKPLSGSQSNHHRKYGPRQQIVCYNCGESGHKVPQCPSKSQQKTQNLQNRGTDKGVQPKPLRRVWNREGDDPIVKGSVSGVEIPILLDTGARITVVPQSIVRPEEINYKEKMAVRPFQSPVPFIWPTATLTFKFGEHEWEEKVVVAPGDPEGGEKVLYS